MLFRRDGFKVDENANFAGEIFQVVIDTPVVAEQKRLKVTLATLPVCLPYIQQGPSLLQ